MFKSPHKYAILFYIQLTKLCNWNYGCRKEPQKRGTTCFAWQNGNRMWQMCGKYV